MSDHVCECYELPDQGYFLVGKQYKYQYIIDGIRVKDENGIDINFDDVKWLWYFR